MGRPRRIDTPGAWHHVMNRGAGRRIVFRTDIERRLFVALLAELDRRFGVEVHAFCLMGNHYHLVVRSRDGRLSEAMGWLGSRFTLETNHRRGVDGAIFRGRFHSLMIERSSHLDWLFRYVNANPLDLGWDKRLAEYPWSGLGTNLGEVDRTWMHRSYVAERWSDDGNAFELFVESARSTDGAVERLARPDDTEIEDAVRLAAAPGPDVVSDAVQRSAHTLLSSSAGIERPRTVAHLSDRAGRNHISRCRSRAETDGELQALLRRARSVLSLGNASAGLPSLGTASSGA